MANWRAGGMCLFLALIGPFVILLCSVLHATVDIAFTSDFLNQNVVNYSGMLITVAGLLVLFIARPADLPRQKKVKAPGCQA